MYREVFETVLFYAAMWADGDGWPLLAGLAGGAVLFVLLAALLLRTSARLPIGQLFASNSLLVAVLAVVLAGQGVAGLQATGQVASSTVAFPRIDLLGIRPTWQTLLARLAAVLFVVAAYLKSMRSVATATTRRNDTTSRPAATSSISGRADSK